jgi:hypothetical protein
LICLIKSRVVAALDVASPRFPMTRKIPGAPSTGQPEAMESRRARVSLLGKLDVTSASSMSPRQARCHLGKLDVTSASSMSPMVDSSGRECRSSEQHSSVRLERDFLMVTLDSKLRRSLRRRNCAPKPTSKPRRR